MDTSSILKLYLPEIGSTETRTAFGAADEIATSMLTYAEVRAALARARRDRRIRSARAASQVRETFEADWAQFFRVDLTERAIRSAGDFAEQYALSGIDAVHLASALTDFGRASIELQFSSWDGRLIRAAISEGLSLAHEVST